MFGKRKTKRWIVIAAILFTIVGVISGVHYLRMEIKYRKIEERAKAESEKRHLWEANNKYLVDNYWKSKRKVKEKDKALGGLRGHAWERKALTEFKKAREEYQKASERLRTGVRRNR